MPAGGSSSLVTFGARSRGQDQADGPDWGRSWETLPQESQFGFSSGFPNSDVRVLIKNSILSLLLSTFASRERKCCLPEPQERLIMGVDYIKVPWGDGANEPWFRAGGGAN